MGPTIVAITDGPSLRRWEIIKGEVAMRHAIPNKSFQTKFTKGRLPDWWLGGQDVTCADIEGLLKTFNVSTALLMHAVLDSTIEDGRVTADIDNLIRMIGWKPRSVTEREQMRRKVWSWMLAFDAMEVHGKRPGQYRDRMTKEVHDLTSADPLIAITGRRYADSQQMCLDRSEVPVEVTWVAGEWLERFRNDKRIVTHFGNIRKIATIPAGKPSGAWAQSIGMALNQRWREGSADAEVKSDGNGQHKTARFSRSFTRFELLDMFPVAPPIPTVIEVLQSPNPLRAIKYWEDAVSTLQRCGVIGKKLECYTEIDPFPLKDGKPKCREGWQQFWLYEQRLDIRPNPDGTEQVAKISTQARKVRRAIAQKRSRKRAAIA
jgi:hypothetical protein